MTPGPRRGRPRRGPDRTAAAAAALAVLVGVGLVGCGDEPPAGERSASPVPGYEYEACFDPGSRTAFGPQFGETRLEVVSDSGEGSTCAAVADTPAARAQGLMGVEDWQGFGAMLFVFEETVDGGFTMRDTPMPLSIAWFDSEGDLVSTADMEPCLDQVDCPSYRADGPYQFAVEVEQGHLPNLAVTDDSARLVLDG